MAVIPEVFQNETVILPVIHVRTLEQTLKNTQIAQDAGADGVFLISMEGMDALSLFNIHLRVKQKFPDFWTGVNYLDLEAKEAFKFVDWRVNGVWSDNAKIDERVREQKDAIEIAEARSGYNGLYFGGVAHKYQRPVFDLERAATLAKDYMDVVTTTGPGTGQAADLEKVEQMSKLVGRDRMGLASGTSPENIESFKPYVKHFLVATSLMESIEYFNSKRVAALVKAVR
jgi:uncharacterized protein